MGVVRPGEGISFQYLETAPSRTRSRQRRRRFIVTALAAVVILSSLVALELRTSWLEWSLLPGIAAKENACSLS